MGYGSFVLPFFYIELIACKKVKTSLSVLKALRDALTSPSERNAECINGAQCKPPRTQIEKSSDSVCATVSDVYFACLNATMPKGFGDE